MISHLTHRTATAARITILAAMLTLSAPSTAQAAPACPNGARPTASGVCIRQLDRLTICAWPAQIGGDRTAVCSRQPGRP